VFFAAVVYVIGYFVVKKGTQFAVRGMMKAGAAQKNHVQNKAAILVLPITLVISIMLSLIYPVLIAKGFNTGLVLVRLKLALLVWAFFLSATFFGIHRGVMDLFKNAKSNASNSGEAASRLE
jgi:hypothetical protein